LIFSDGATSIQLIAVDPDDMEYDLASASGEVLKLTTRETYPLLPEWQLKVVVDNAVGADGAKVTVAVALWFQPTAAQFG